MHDASPLLRQWTLLRAIAGDRESTVKSLAAVTGMSEKTIRRDVSLLRRVGFPIEERSGDYGRRTFFLNRPHTPALEFTYDEALALYLCRRASTGFGGTFVEQALAVAFRKIETSLGRRAAIKQRQYAGRPAAERRPREPPSYVIHQLQYSRGWSYRCYECYDNCA